MIRARFYAAKSRTTSSTCRLNLDSTSIRRVPINAFIGLYLNQPDAKHLRRQGFTNVPYKVSIEREF